MNNIIFYGVQVNKSKIEMNLIILWLYVFFQVVITGLCYIYIYNLRKFQYQNTPSVNRQFISSFNPFMPENLPDKHLLDL